MSTLGDALKGVKQLLVMQEQVRQLGALNDRQNATIEELAREVVGLDKRIVRIETMIEMANRPQPAPRLEG